MFVLIVLAAAGAFLAGPTGALVGYVLGLVVTPFLPEAVGGACRVDRAPPLPEERPQRPE